MSTATVNSAPQAIHFSHESYINQSIQVTSIGPSRVDNKAPVRLSLVGPNRSYCHLKGIEDPKLKEVLAKVMDAFEKNIRAFFFDVTHIFTPTESKSSDDRIAEDLNSQILSIFTFARTAVAGQTGDKLQLQVTDITKFIVEKAEDGGFLPPHRAYELNLVLTEKAVKTARELGLVFREHASSSVSEVKADRTQPLSLGERVTRLEKLVKVIEKSL